MTNFEEVMSKHYNYWLNPPAGGQACLPAGRYTEIYQMSTNKKGLVYVFSGEGKGKTSAALGIAIRSLAHNQKVVWISWYKDTSWPIGEIRLSEMLIKKYRDRLMMYWIGKGFYLKDNKTKRVGESGVVYDFDTPVGHKIAAESGLKLANDVLAGKIPHRGSSPDLLVLDEILVAVEDKLLSKKDIVELISKRGMINMVLTGRGETDWLKERVDLISEINKVKHPFDLGKLAVSGLDF